MALYVIYRKTAETETEVTYRFGSSETELKRELVIEKHGPAVKAADATIDPLVMKVAGRILARKGNDPNWPGGGGIQA
ncbi:hypothetical protein IU471_00765 [Nocardia elegans]|uniref:hypothetical protein n=1 Tax=Nocardia elegans TaxID=300029 RepID=UPI0018954F4F|nr:hypothetical protein [Nocardia elegans]MBF6242109.1 hypothetical protein [Nocardia elegans]